MRPEAQVANWLAYRLGQSGYVGVVHDGRRETLSRAMFLMGELNAYGITTIELGVSPLPAASYYVMRLGLDHGVFISGERIYLIDSSGIPYELPQQASGRASYVEWYRVGQSAHAYIEELYVGLQRRLIAAQSGKNVVVSLGGGVARNILPRLLRDLGARVTTLGAAESSEALGRAVNGLDELRAAVEAWEADVGISVSTDGLDIVVILNGSTLAGRRLSEELIERYGFLQALEESSVERLTIEARRVEGVGIGLENGLVADPATGVPSVLHTALLVVADKVERFKG